MPNHHCRVCGYYIESPPWGEDGKTPTYAICPCCGVEFGYEDYTPESAKAYRQNWIKNGTNWFHAKLCPQHWNSEIQFKNIPDDFLKL